MPTRKIGDVPFACTDHEHNPPSHAVFEPGVYEHICPTCGHKTVFTVTRVMCSTGGTSESNRQ